MPERLLDRADELADIASTIRAAHEGSGRVLVFEGPAGIGKSALLDAASDGAHDGGLRTLRAAGSELEREFAFGVARQLFEPVLAEPTGWFRSQPLTGAARGAGVVFGEESTGPGGERSFPAMNGLYWLTVDILEFGPLLICIDDAHFCDLSSLRWLAFLAHRIECLALSVVLGLRFEGDRESLEVLGAIGSERNASTSRLSPLSYETVGAFIEERTGMPLDDQGVAASYRATGGNPFLLQELALEIAREKSSGGASTAEWIANSGPTSIARSMTMRLSKLSPSTSALAAAVAIFERCELGQAAALAGIELTDAEEAADALVRATILRDGRPLAFEHPIVRSAVYRNMSTAERAGRHRAAARLLLEAGAPLELGAGHLLMSQPSTEGWVVATLRAAASEARDKGAPETAVTYLRRALEESPGDETRPGTLWELGSAELSSGIPAAVGHLEDALESTTDVDRRAPIALELGLALTLANRIPEAADILRAALEPPELEHEVRLRLQGRLVWTAAQDLHTRFLVREEWMRHGVELAGETPAERVLLGHLAFEMSIAAMPAQDVIASATRALGDGLLLEEEGSESLSFSDAVPALAYADQLDEAYGAYDEALRDARDRGSVLGFALTMCFRSEAAFRRGQLDRAEADARGALEVVEREGLGFLEPFAAAALAQVLIEHGALDEAERSIVSATERAGKPGTLGTNQLSFMAARVELAKGLSEGVDRLYACGRWLDRWGAINPAVMPWRSIVATFPGVAGAEAQRLADEELDLARRVGCPGAIGVALRARGIAASDGGIDQLREAVAMLEGTPRRLELARTLVDLGAAERRTGSRTRARETLSLGMDIATRCRAIALSDRARDELFASGARPRRRSLTGLDALTPSERRVAEMAARGSSNRDIAQSLFVTIRTVEIHLSHAYQKLGIASRASLPPPEAFRLEGDAG